MTTVLTCVSRRRLKPCGRGRTRPGTDALGDRQRPKVTLKYYDKRYPYDVADWRTRTATRMDAEAAATIASL